MERANGLGIMNSFRRIIPKSNIYNNAACRINVNCNILIVLSLLFVMIFFLVFFSHSIPTGTYFREQKTNWDLAYICFYMHLLA